MAKAAGSSVRLRLLLLALLPTLLLTPLLIGVTTTRWTWRMDQVLIARVASDLAVARRYLLERVEGAGRAVEALGLSAEFQGRLAAGDSAALLAESRARLGLDYLLLTDEAGRILAASPPEAHPAPESPLLAPERSGGEILLIGPEDLAALSPALAERARIPLSDASGEERRGLIVRATSRAPLADGAAGLLTGGLLLNRDEGFVDRIGDLVYPATRPETPPEAREGLDLGVVTLFLEDLRVATTLRPSGGARALGTRASEAVRAQVLEQGEGWRDLAFVVDAWYFSAYDAIHDAQGRRVGMLYAGVPKAPYAAARRITWAISGAAFLAVALLTLPLFLRWARSVFRPLEAMGATISRVEAGDMAARSRAASGPSADEIARLARHFDGLLDQLQARDQELRGLNGDLNARVEARTAELLRANQALEAATRRLILSEKLAAIGEMAAGVAHEINNPLAVMQGNLEVLRMLLEDRLGEVGTELHLIEEQVSRMEALARQLLQFARPEEFAEGAVNADPRRVAEGIRPLLRHLLEAGGVDLALDPRSARRVAMSAHELRQILVNLLSNAVQATPRGGVVRLFSEDSASEDGRPGVALTIRDQGPGMKPEVLARIFDPFFTTRGLRGTGLGLAICQTLVARRGGELRARSAPGEGSSFTLWLPEEAPSVG
ncbi:sensor histidine kinase [Neomegalonema perideroedes]|uniref:sensor histidine kinase n=1 Tax=Neomegalonema perideroedes TaxID=217219 RepID=UPI00036B09A6|nr:cache domain-containing protein [Neomegalonema perideroedes]